MSLFSIVSEAAKKFRQSREQIDEEKNFFSEWQNKVANASYISTSFSKESDSKKNNIVTYTFDDGSIKFYLDTHTVSFYDATNTEIKSIKCDDKNNKKSNDIRAALFSDLLNTAIKKSKRNNRQTISDIPVNDIQERYKIEHELKILHNVEEQIQKTKTIYCDAKTQTYTLDVWKIYFNVLRNKLVITTKTHKVLYSIKCEYNPDDILKQQKHDYFFKLSTTARKRYEEKILSDIIQEIHNTDVIQHFSKSHYYALNTMLIQPNSQNHELKVYMGSGKSPYIINCKNDDKNTIQQEKYRYFNEIWNLVQSRKNDIQENDEYLQTFLNSNPRYY